MGGFVGNMPVGTLNVALSNYAKEFRNNTFVGETFAPRVPVPRQSYQYVVWNRDDFRVPGNTQRAPGDRPVTTRRGYSVEPYMCSSHAISTDIPRETEAYGLGLGFSTKKQATQQVMNQLNLDKEVAIADLLLNTTNFPNGVTLSGGSQWDSYITTPADDDIDNVTSNPIVVVDGYKSVLRQAGIQDSQMALLLSDPVAQAVRNHPFIVDRFKFTSTGGIITDEMLSRVFGVKVIVASAIQLNQQNTPSWVWGYDAFLGYAQAAPTQQDVSCAKCFVWAGGTDDKGNVLPGPDNTVDGYGVLEFPDPYLDSKKDWISADWYYGLEITAVETGIPILNAVSSANFPMGTIPSDVEG
jgi:hypothetical protein